MRKRKKFIFDKLEFCKFRENNFKTNNNLEVINTNFKIISDNWFEDDKLNILIVDDHKLIRDTSANLIKNVMSTLNIRDFKIIEGSDGIDLLNLVRSDKDHKIKYIFTDENMIYLNGSKAVWLIRKLNKMIRFKIIKLLQ